MQLSVTARLATMVLGVALLVPAGALAGPVDEARAKAEEGRSILEKAERARARDKKSELLAEGLGKYATAYRLLTTNKLQNDAPDLLQEISEKIAETNALPEVAAMRRDLLSKAIDAAIEGDITECFNRLEQLRALDPREWTVEYALTVIGQHMEGG